MLTKEDGNSKGLNSFGVYVANAILALPRDLQIKARGSIQNELTMYETIALEREV
jgi:hypothetical protein